MYFKINPDLEQNVDPNIAKPKVFILISTIMTWTRTKTEQDYPDSSLTEEEYRRRKPHPNFKNHMAAEKAVIKCGKKGGLKTYVIASGLIYHSGDCIFHQTIKSAWSNQQVDCYGEGANVLPTIHMDDLCSIVFEISETAPETRYILAIDDSKNTLYEITKSISEALSTGKVVKVAKESALLNKSITQSDYDMLISNNRIDAGFVKEMNFEWKYESGLIENIATFVQEFKDARGFLPIKCIVHGPPSSGKTLFSKKIAQIYEIHHVDVETVVNEKMARLVAFINKGKTCGSRWCCCRRGRQ